MGAQHPKYKAQELRVPSPLILCGPGLTLEISVLLQQGKEDASKQNPHLPSRSNDILRVLPGYAQTHPVAPLSSASFTNSKNQNVDVT